MKKTGNPSSKIIAIDTNINIGEKITIIIKASDLLNIKNDYILQKLFF